MAVDSISNISNRCLIVIPTYNEIGSIQNLLEELAAFRFNILIVDDNSPDGTADFVSNLKLPQVRIFRRPKKEGLGAAYKAAVEFAFANNFEFTYLVSMDGDGSHQVSDLIKMLGKIEQEPQASLLIGSRWIKNGGIRNWNGFRIFLSKTGTRYARWALKLPVNDLTGGFRIYPRKSLERIDLAQINSNGYCYQIEMAFAIKHLNQRIIEHPITFVERAAGQSKMSLKVVLEAIWRVTLLGAQLRLRPKADKLHYVK
jgi:dolichol-phosphate mannosyltransferase